MTENKVINQKNLKLNEYILIVNDEQDITDVIKNICESLQYPYITFTNH